MSIHPLLAQGTTEYISLEPKEHTRAVSPPAVPWGAEARLLSRVCVRNGCAAPAHGDTPVGLHPLPIHECQIASFLHT